MHAGDARLVLHVFGNVGDLKAGTVGGEDSIATGESLRFLHKHLFQNELLRSSFDDQGDG
ncbi:hypothetical protein D3C83_243830 [compost metagenome]